MGEKLNRSYRNHIATFCHPPLLLVKRLFATSFSCVPLSTRTWRRYSCLESRPATVARPRVVVSISSGCWTSGKEKRFRFKAHFSQILTVGAACVGEYYFVNSWCNAALQSGWYRSTWLLKYSSLWTPHHLSEGGKWPQKIQNSDCFWQKKYK